jgi:bifunctional DNA-binding transcriptional regulator/antitoxin component of YhaV-PrlF toxin-antitoxin module
VSAATPAVHNPGMRFHATLELGGKAATGIEVPAVVVTGLGSHRRPPVLVTINGYSYRSTVATMGGRFMIPVSADVRKHAGVEAGDELDVDVELDEQPREVAVPDDLAAALDAEPSARVAFDALTYSNKRAHVLSVEGAKAADTRSRRITKIVDTLR